MWTGARRKGAEDFAAESLEDANPAGRTGTVAQPPPEITSLGEGMVFNPPQGVMPSGCPNPATSAPADSVKY